ncbi:MAG TPA: cell division protein FtsA [Verrucomicrobiae bacterium]|nr:cell division protein FtsA [Verrucomicrobiae bacterium]
MMIFARRERDIVAVDIGTAKVAVAVATVDGDGPMRLLGVGESPSAGVRKGEIIEAGAAKEALRDAMARAEVSAGIEILEVHLALSGAHLQCTLRSAVVDIRGEGRRVDQEDVARVCRAAEEAPMPPERVHVATLPGRFVIDGGEAALRPVGVRGRCLKGEFLIVDGATGVLKDTIRQVQELEIRVEDVVLAPVASAEMVLTPELRAAGALLVDMGAGLTHFAAILGDRVVHVGALGVGGDHVTQDIGRAFAMPWAKAEEVKTRHGSVDAPAGGKADATDLGGSKPADREPAKAARLAMVMRARWEEAFEIVRDRIPGEILSARRGGVVLTGGGSRTGGIGALAEQVSGLRTVPARTDGLAGDPEIVSRPELSTVLGSLIWARRQIQEEGRGGH